MKVFLAMLVCKVDYELVNEPDDDGITSKPNTAMAQPLDGLVVRACPAAT